MFYPHLVLWPLAEVSMSASALKAPHPLEEEGAVVVLLPD